MDSEDFGHVISITQAEIIALKKLILYVKFTCEESESLEYASSYSINNFFDKLIEVDSFKEAAKAFYNERNIDNEKFVMHKIKAEQENSINKMDDEILKEVFKESLYPFKTE
ncbi:hypothetical protein OO184_24360 [Photorhabdus sp. APURE]|uniref:hypothetical protein n=1 Tax=Photorhabdus aballayi TaxID=2991723 RepID=UPI00223E3B88|nr:hypothetical protein [Photorhabdus aballayi]MCW7550974.1 hypothetical protein [Photorhabdus aballayi]